MGKPLTLLNLALGLIAVLLAAALAKTWVSPRMSSLPNPSEARSSQEPAAPALARVARPLLSEFEVLMERSPFKQPPPPAVTPSRPAVPPGPPPPLPTLVGTILVESERQAILSDKGKASIYSIGQEVAGGTLTSITDDRVLFKRGDVISELTLKAPIQPGAAPPPPASVTPPAVPAAAPPVAPPPLPPGAIEGTPSGATLSGAEHRRPRLLWQQHLRGPSQETGK